MFSVSLYPNMTIRFSVPVGSHLAPRIILNPTRSARVHYSFNNRAAQGPTENEFLLAEKPALCAESAGQQLLQFNFCWQNRILQIEQVIAVTKRSETTEAIYEFGAEERA